MQIRNVKIETPYILAPLAGVTTRHFRYICHQFGSGAGVTEMVRAGGIVCGDAYTTFYTEPYPDEYPLWVQLYGNDPKQMALAAQTVAAKGAHLVDINMGCPVRKILKQGAGSALMGKPELAEKIMQAVCKAVNIPVTIKIRSGLDEQHQNFLDIAERAIASGVAAITIHPRTTEQVFSGKADHSLTRVLKEKVQVPVIASGDIRSVEDAKLVQKNTGADAFMIARGCLGRPWLFQALQENNENWAPSKEVRWSVFERHLNLHLSDYPTAARKGVQAFRNHFIWYTKGLVGGAEVRKRLPEFNTAEDMLAAFAQLLQSR